MLPTPVALVHRSLQHSHHAKSLDGAAHLRRRNDQQFRKFGLIESGIPWTTVAGLNEKPQESKLWLRHLESAEPRHDVARR